MPTYTCPYCRKQVTEVKVYHHEPDRVTCPYCKRDFKPNQQQDQQ
jgi:uncharacterized CHY-type Zn-finger protein